MTEEEENEMQHCLLKAVALIPLFFQQGSSRAGLESVHQLGPVPHVLTAKELTLSQERWFEREPQTHFWSRTKNLLTE